MSDLIYRQAAIEAQERIMSDHPLDGYEDERLLINALKDLPSAQPEPAIPLSWIEGQIKWLKSLDNAFSTVTAEQISAMVNKWKDEQDE